LKICHAFAPALPGFSAAVDTHDPLDQMLGEGAVTATPLEPPERPIGAGNECTSAPRNAVRVHDRQGERPECEGLPTTQHLHERCSSRRTCYPQLNARVHGTALRSPTSGCDCEGRLPAVVCDRICGREIEGRREVAASRRVARRDLVDCRCGIEVRLETIQPCRGVPDGKLGNSLLPDLLGRHSHDGTRLRLS
jgi:hypothetical protein